MSGSGLWDDGVNVGVTVISTVNDPERASVTSSTSNSPPTEPHPLPVTHCNIMCVCMCVEKYVHDKTWIHSVMESAKKWGRGGVGGRAPEFSFQENENQVE